MRTSWALGIAGLCSLATGCQLVTTAVHNLANETKLAVAEVQERHRYKNLALAHWQRVRQAAPAKNYSNDYFDGFICGFIDFLEFGGNGQPPTVPPQHYWSAKYRTPEGYRAIEEWY